LQSKIIQNVNGGLDGYWTLSNLLKRLIVALILGTLVVTALFVHPILLFIISLIWITLATIEFLHILSLKQISINRFLIIGLNLAIPVIFYFRGSPLIYLGLLFIVFLYVLFKQEQYYLVVPYSLFTIFYLGVLPSYLLFLKIWVRNHGLSSLIVLFPVLFTWVNDTAAYGVGSWIGRHKLASKISPNKTIEGFIGSIIFSVIFSCLYFKVIFPQLSVVISVVVGIILSVGAQVGDLVESGFKREVGIKDSSGILPGHGGFLDRVDSLLFTVPIFYYILLYIIAL
jgi:phosphatidate cytidylyltransferase